MNGTGQHAWQVVHVEDDATMRAQVKDYLEGESFEFGKLHVVGTGEFDDALALLRERKVDLVILDVYRGTPLDRDSAGLPVLESWRAVGFTRSPDRGRSIGKPIMSEPLWVSPQRRSDPTCALDQPTYIVSSNRTTLAI